MGRSFLFLCHTPSVRGGSIFAMGQLVRALTAAGNAVTVVSPTPEQDGQQPIDPGLQAGVHVLEYPMPALGGVFLGYRGEIDPPGVSFDDYVSMQRSRALPLLERAVARHKPDIIVMGHEIYVWEILDRIRPWGIPIAVLAHGPLAAIVNDEMSERFREPLLDHLRRADLVLPVARYMTRFAKRSGITAHTLHNILHTDKFTPAAPDAQLRGELSLADDDIVVLHASTLRIVKRPMDIAEAAAAALRREPRLAFLILGDGALRQKMQARCAVLGIADRFRFAGWVPHGDIHRYLRLADMTALMSASEGMPYIALEAFSCQRPVVTSDIAWTAEVQEGGPSMLLYPVGDTVALAGQLVATARDPDLRRRLGVAGRAYVKRHHRQDSVVKKFSEVIAPLLGIHVGQN